MSYFWRYYLEQLEVNKVFNKSEINSIFIRYFLFSFVGIETLIIPKIIDKSTYASFEYIKYIIYLSPLFLMGIPSGMVYQKMKNGYDLQRLMMSALILSIIVGTVISLVTNNFIYSLVIISFVFCGIIESVLKVNKKFNLALALKPLISVMILVYILFFIKFKISIELYVNVSILSAIFLWIYMSKVNILTGKIFEIKELLICIKYGILITASTLLFGIFIFIDRFFAKNYYEGSLSDYSLAFSLSQVVVLGLTTLNYISTINIGENINNIDKKYVKKLIIRSMVLMIFITLTFILFTKIFLIEFYKSYDFFKLYLFLTLSKSIFFTVGVVTPIIFYKNKIHYSFIFILIGLMVHIFLTYFLFIPNNFSFEKIVISSSFILIVISISNFSLSYRLAN